jgi:hypothetical protein
MQNKLIYIGLLFLFFAACNKETAPDCFKKSGTETTIVRYTSTFSTIILNTDLDVELFQSQETRIEITGGKNLIPKVETKVSNNTLEIDNTNTCDFVRGYKKKITMKVYTPYVRTIRNKGVGNIQMPDKFIQDSLQVFAESVGDIMINGEFDELVSNSGSHGDVYAKGNAKRFFVYITGTNYVKALDLLCDYVYVNNYGLGDTHINLSQTTLFQYLIRSEGNIYYSGNPQQFENLENSNAKGKLIQLP